MDELLLSHVDKLSRTGSSRTFLPVIKHQQQESPFTKNIQKPNEINKLNILKNHLDDDTNRSPVKFSNRKKRMPRLADIEEILRGQVKERRNNLS